MPAFYNAYIHLLQRRALSRWLAAPAGSRVLEIGCGIGRWTQRMARQGHDIVGFDLSQTMIGDARRRAAQEQLSARCHFMVADCATVSLSRQFDRILDVTVLQHVLDDQRFAAAIAGIARHLAPGGRAIVLEAAPTRPTSRCDSGVFVARTEAQYVEAFAQAGLTCVAVCGVDPAPFRMWFLPWYRFLPRVVAVPVMFALTVAGAPLDLLPWPGKHTQAWHKVFVLEHTREARS
jgi:ubiquinone/menaquinone biosynthesis C-methylase UbiE